MKRFLVFSSILFITTLTNQAQVIGKVFPDMVAEDVEDKKVMLPKDVAGKYTLTGLAYSKKSEDELNTWFQPVFVDGSTFSSGRTSTATRN